MVVDLHERIGHHVRVCMLLCASSTVPLLFVYCWYALRYNCGDRTPPVPVLPQHMAEHDVREDPPHEQLAPRPSEPPFPCWSVLRAMVAERRFAGILAPWVVALMLQLCAAAQWTYAQQQQALVVAAAHAIPCDVSPHVLFGVSWVSVHVLVVAAVLELASTSCTCSKSRQTASLSGIPSLRRVAVASRSGSPGTRTG